MLKILHTSDWHLGKKLFKADRIEEQKLFLDWLFSFIQTESVDVLLIAGDIFDSPHPPNEALKLYFDFLHELAKTKVQTFVIAGNHDSGTFLEAPSKILQTQNIHVTGSLSLDSKKHIFKLSLKNSDQYVGLVTLPYFRNWEIHQLGKEYGIAEGENFAIDTLAQFLKNSSSELSGASKKILMGHHLFGLYSAAGSEQAIGLSGVDSIPNSMVEGLFDYVALGHIHKPQIIKKENPIIYYSGSPIAMRFSETMKKSLSLVTIDQDKLTQTLVFIPSFRQLIQIECSEDDLDAELEHLKKIPKLALRHFVECIIHLKAPSQGLIEKIKLTVEEDHELLSTSFIFDTDDELEKELYRDIKRGLSLPEIFDVFYKSKFSDSIGPSVELKADFMEIMKRSQDHDDGASSP
ncbi:MAG: metallophosphoesterase family protein [Bacteriovoracaceae bacterium]